MRGIAAVPGTGYSVCVMGVSSPPGEIPAEAVFLNQVHGSRVLVSPEPGREADGMVLPREEGRFPGLLTADCLPVFGIWDDRIGCAHAGWRGLAAGVLESFCAAGGGSPRAVVLGPCICGGCYTVGDEVRSLFVGEHRPGGDAHPPGRLDLKLAAAGCFSGATVVYSIEACTLCTPGFHSYRRNGTGLRNRIWLAPSTSCHDIPASVTLFVEPYKHSGRRPA